MPFGKFLKRPKTIRALKLTLDTALKVLEITEDVLNTTPIPGAAAVISVILDVVKRQDRANKNAELVTEQQERWGKLASEMEKCETHSESNPTDALSELRGASSALGIRLRKYAQKLQEDTAHKYRPEWMTCGGDEEALQDFLRKSNEAIEDYHRAQSKRIEECVIKIQGIVGAIDMKVGAVDTKVDGIVQENKMKGEGSRIILLLELHTYILMLLEWNRLIRELPRAELAPYNADRSAGTLTSCSKGTREPLLKDVSDWVVDPKADRIYWLKERAGFGKTAVAHSVAEQAAKEGTLAASFFFSYQIPDLNHASHVITTIIYQLSLVGGAPYKQSLAEAIENHPDTLRAQLKDQVQPLFLDPLKSFNLASPNRPVVIVIDALDECQADGAQYLINTFIAAFLSLNLPLKLFITSRPEAHLTAAFSDLGVSHRAVVDTSNEDIETYLRAELAKIPNKPGIRELSLPREWITEKDIQALLERAGAKSVASDSSSAEKGLFIYIATVIRLIGDMRRCDPQKHLKIVLSATPQVSSHRPFQVLDNLYTRVLDVALEGAEDLLGRFHAVIGGIMAVVNGNYLSVLGLEMLLDLPRGEVRKTLVNLQSVIRYPDTDTEPGLPSFHHRSFTDFLADKHRSGPRYYIDLKPHQKCFALGCLRVMATSPLKVEVTNAMNKEDYFFYPEIDSISPEFRYASSGLYHYSESVQGDRDFLEELEKFIRADFGWCCELYPQINCWDFYKISDAVDPQDELDLPILYRALASSLSIGNQEEVERSRKRTTFLRHQVKPLLGSGEWLVVTADELEAFEQQGVWTLKSTGPSDYSRP